MSTALDVLIVNPGGRDKAYQKLGGELAAMEPPIWAGLLASFLRGKGLRVEILDTDALGLGPEAASKWIEERDPLLTAVVVYGHNPNASTWVMPGVRSLCGAIKARNRNRRLLLLGGHVSALPERTLREEEADYVCDGEGTYTLLDLVRELKSGSPDLHRVRGILFFQDGEIQRSEPAPFVVDLDREMPGMAWDLLPMDRYRAHNWHCFGEEERSPYAAIYTTLGCPFRCSFCCIQAPFKQGEKALGYKPQVNSYRKWSPQRIGRQIEILVENYGVRHLKIADEIFLLDKEHVEGVCDEILRRGYDLNIWAYARVDTVRDQALLHKMRRAGFRWLALGIESANREVRKDVSKGYREEKIEETVQKIQAAGIHIIGNYIFGLPEDDLDSMRETLELAKSLNTEYANFNSAMAYPGSALYREALERGWPLPKTWDGYSQHSKASLPLPTRHISSREVLAFRDQAFREYFEREEYLERVEKAFGPKVREQVREMTSKSLERDLLET
ncbi:MAG TPA: radical SAM protein [Planctomycetes bacterium]|nr:radical SAM protein [Planctomycetota bacterium]